jgi:hypothetical protein
MKFLNAYHNLYTWNGFYEPDYLDQLWYQQTRSLVRFC